MDTALFIKASNGLTLASASQQINQQRLKGSKQIIYNPIVSLQLDEISFSSVVNPIFQVNDIYNKYGAESVAGKDGTWNCIVINNLSSSEKMVIYTGGRTIPLYLSYLSNS
ncbi:hypothetical protein AGMMS50284_4110 [Clostridia bacterium]|nr:hypothetical protein AGMMS50284_4110 [Clostridia bacterium]